MPTKNQLPTATFNQFPRTAIVFKANFLFRFIVNIETIHKQTEMQKKEKLDKSIHFI